MIGIIGGGPAGSWSAYNLARAGEDVTIFEEHNKVGEPVACTGILSKNILDIVEMKRRFLVNKVKGARIFAPNGEMFEVKTKEVQAYIVDRAGFDKYLIEKALDAGAKLELNRRFLDYKNERARFKDKEVKVGKLIGADGPKSSVARAVGLYWKREFFYAAQVDMKLERERDFVELYLGSEFPGFFGWVVPSEDGVCRVGMAATEKTGLMFNKFLKKYRGKVCGSQGGLIPKYDKDVKTVKDNVYLVGDAALQNKSTTGGGILMGMLCAEELSKAILNNKDYERAWRDKVGRDLWLHLKIRSMMNKFSDNDYNKFIKIMNENKVDEFLAKKGDMDFPTKFLFKMVLRNLNLARFLF